MRKVICRTIFITLILTWTLAENKFTTTVSKAQDVSFTASKTMEKNKMVTKKENFKISKMEPYYNKQWALNNDGTFTLDNTKYIDMIQNYDKKSETTSKPQDSNTDETISIPDQTVTIPEDFFSFPEITPSTPDESVATPGEDSTYPEEIITTPDEDYNFPDESWWDYNGYDNSYDYDTYYYEWDNSYSDSAEDNVGVQKIEQNRKSSFVSQLAQTDAVKDIDIDAKEAWEVVGNQGKEVIVAVIDTGCDYNHEDLKESMWKNEKEIPDDNIDNDNNGFVDDVYGWDFFNNKPYTIATSSSEYDHGTHIAGVIAAKLNNTGVAGIVPNSNIKIMSIKSLGGSKGYGNPEWIMQGIKYAEKMGASICNISFGTPDNIPNLLQTMQQSKMLFVCAAGNAGNDYTNRNNNADENPTYPAAYDLDNIISVANLTFDGTLDASSYYGSRSVDIAAPGTAVFSTLSGNQYGYMSGTSMATPMVTAVTAMVYSYFDNISLLDARKIVLNSVNPLDSLAGKVSTRGMLNAYNAVTYDLSKLR